MSSTSTTELVLRRNETSRALVDLKQGAQDHHNRRQNYRKGTITKACGIKEEVLSLQTSRESQKITHLSAKSYLYFVHASVPYVCIPRYSYQGSHQANLRSNILPQSINQ